MKPGIKLLEISQRDHMLIDTHAHLDHFSDEEIPGILERARVAGIEMIISSGTTLQSSTRSVKLSAKFNEFFAGVGIHPMNLIGPISESNCEQMAQLAKSSEKVLVISEIGLDFMNGSPDRAIQYQAFRQQIKLALNLNIPIVFHSRDAHLETLRILREESAYKVGGIMHYFQASLDIAYQAIDLGFLISLARPLLRLPELQKVVENIPLKHIVLESDSAPQPFKTKRENWTEPRHVKCVASKLAEIKRTSIEEIKSITSQNFLMISRAKKTL